MKKLILGAVLVVGIVIVALLFISRPADNGMEEAAEGFVVEDAIGPGKDAELLKAIGAQPDRANGEPKIFQSFLSSQNERMVVVWGYEHSAAWFVATFDVDSAGNARLKNANHTNAKGALNHYQLEDVRWNNEEETEILYVEVKGGPGGTSRVEKVIVF